MQQQFFSAKSWSNWDPKVSFRFCSSRRFRNTPWNPKLTTIWWSNWLPQKPCLLLVVEKIREHDFGASITQSISDQIRLPGGVLESSWQANSETVLWNPVSSRFYEENIRKCCCKLIGYYCTLTLFYIQTQTTFTQYQLIWDKWLLSDKAVSWDAIASKNITSQYKFVSQYFH